MEWLERAELRRHAKFGRNRSNRGRDMVIFRFFKMASGAMLDFSSFKFITVGRLKRADLRRRAKFLSKSVKPRPRYGAFSIFQDGDLLQDGGRRHLRFLKFGTFNAGTAREGRTASPREIWSKSVKPWPRYGDFSIFQDGVRRHIGFFFKFQIFNGRAA